MVGFSFSDVVGTIAVWAGGCAVLCIIGLLLMGVSCSVLPFSGMCCGFGLCVSLGVLVATWVFVVCCGVCMYVASWWYVGIVVVWWFLICFRLLSVRELFVVLFDNGWCFRIGLLGAFGWLLYFVV